MRGNPQNKTMCNEHMRAFLGQISYIDSVTFTGGEPTLPSAMRVIESFMEICNDLGINVGNFYIVTNAKVWRNKFPELINRLFNFCTENEISGIDISGDKFHETNGIEKNDFRYRLEEELLYTYDIDEMVSIRPNIEYQHIITEGRGYYQGHRKLNIDDIIYSYYNDFHIQEGILYLNCNGDVINGCDWSYESQEKRKDVLICKASDDLEQAILNYEFSLCDDEISVAA